MMNAGPIRLSMVVHHHSGPYIPRRNHLLGLHHSRLSSTSPCLLHCLRSIHPRSRSSDPYRPHRSTWNLLGRLSSTSTSSGPSDALRSNSSIQSDHPSTQDEPKKSIILRSITKIEPYLELSRLQTPIGTILLFLPCGSSLALAASSITASPQLLLSQTFIFATGALIMRGAGCTINDLWDRSIDRKVPRTRMRPLASGALTIPNALGWLGFQLGIGLMILLQLNSYSVVLGTASLALVVSYPLMKRITYWPQLVLGLSFNWGALMGSSAILGQTDWIVAMPLYLGHLCWTIVYDTIYAQQDKKSDVLAGVKSTALLFGPNPVPILAGFSTGFVGLTALSGFMNGCGLSFYTLAVLGPAIHLTHLLRKLDPDSVSSCHDSFKASAITGSLVWLGCLLDYAVRFLQA